MPKEAIKIYINDDYTIDVLFDDRITKKFDIKKNINVFCELKPLLDDFNLYKSGKLIGWGGIIWTNIIDLSTECVFDYGETIENRENIDCLILGYQIKTIRLSLEMSQAELSKKTGIDQSDLSKIERGLFNPTYSLLKRIAEGLNKSLDISFK